MRIGKTKFRPVFVGDVSLAVANILKKTQHKHNIYEIYGPKEYNFNEILQFVLSITKRFCIIVPLPDFITWCIAAFMGIMPGKPFTIDQYKFLGADNIPNKSSKLGNLKDLSIEAKSVESIVPNYLSLYVNKNACHHDT